MTPPQTFGRDLMPTPEELARINIDRQLTTAGWVIQDRAQMNLYAGRGVAVREFPLQTGEADYLLFVDRKAVGGQFHFACDAELRVELFDCHHIFLCY